VGKRALVVDDVLFARKIIGDVLRSLGHQVIAEAADGDEAIDAYKKHKPDFVTMDIVMPNRNGIEACRKIIEGHSEAKIIVISAMSHEQLLMDAINAGARDYILKPFQTADLEKAVNKIFADDEEYQEEASHGT
jgi:two-component system chemotaxis response regulator CheY